MLVATLLLIRAAAIRIPWMQLALDATIFVVGFGTFFWFLVIRPANAHTEVEALKQGLSQAYAGLDCAMICDKTAMLRCNKIFSSGRVGGSRRITRRPRFPLCRSIAERGPHAEKLRLDRIAAR